jgi:hypothetical protein
LSDSTLIIALTCLLAVVVLAFVLRVRPQDLPPAEKTSPFAHLDERKAAIYENLRDLQFEYRVGKLSDADYQNTKTDLQKQLAAVLAEVDRLKTGIGPEVNGTAAAAAAAKPAVKASAFECSHCGAKFERNLKFCGECGKAMSHV